MSKIKFLPNIDEETGKPYHNPQYLYWCEGCGYDHAFALKSEGGHHDFNGDLNNPTVSPSLVQNFTPGKMCHSFIRDGKIEFLGDCWHNLKGQTVELLDIDELHRIRKEKWEQKQKENNP
jgi:hypothetical protein